MTGLMYATEDTLFFAYNFKGEWQVHMRNNPEHDLTSIIVQRIPTSREDLKSNEREKIARHLADEMNTAAKAWHKAGKL